MASSVKVHITDRAVITALGTPGGPVYEWRDQIGAEIKAQAQATSPVNDPQNAVHRGGRVGTYKKGWDWDRRGSRGHHNIARIVNSADHADIVEYGRSGSSRMQIFSWTEWQGEIKRIGGPKPNPRGRSARQRALNKASKDLPPWAGYRTGARPGRHILARAVASALGSQGIAAMTM
jgi:hypothetical protein